MTAIIVLFREKYFLGTEERKQTIAVIMSMFLQGRGCRN